MTRAIGTTVHMCVDIRGLLRRPRRELARALLREDGKRATADEAREWLLDEIAKGRKVLPMGEPCEGFDYVTGCPGHRGEPEPTP